MTRTSWAMPLVLIGLLAGCASGPRPPAEPIALVQAQAEISQNQLMDVGIAVFDPGVTPEDLEEEQQVVFEAVREAEGHFIAIHLKETLQESGYWGAVRTLPSTEHVTDLVVSGEIVESNGFELIIHVKAVDSTGREWLDRTYKQEADSAVYSKNAVQNRDAFQNIYTEVANALQKERNRLDANQVNEIRQITRMRFAADLAPVPYAGYLSVDRRGRTELERLPAEGDPMMARVARIRAREDLFIDTLDQHYANFYMEMEDPYQNWRKFSYQEVLSYNRMKKKATTQKILGALALVGAILLDPSSSSQAMALDLAAMGGLWAIQAGINTSQEAKMHVEAIRELGASFNAEIEPSVIEVEGQTLRLQGSAVTQYEEWRQILREIYAEETGLGSDFTTPPPSPGQ